MEIDQHKVGCSRYEANITVFDAVLELQVGSDHLKEEYVIAELSIWSTVGVGVEVFFADMLHMIIELSDSKVTQSVHYLLL